MKNSTKHIKSILGIENESNLKQVEITPRKAEELLKFNTHNRPRQPLYEQMYAKDMKEGKFGIQDSMITFDDNGILTNGQTRLHACILANTPFIATIFIGLSQNLHMDTGRKRTTISNLILSGELDDILDGCLENKIRVTKSLLSITRNERIIRDETVLDFCKRYGNFLNEAQVLGILRIASKKNKHTCKPSISASFLSAYINGVNTDTLLSVRRELSNCDVTENHMIRDYCNIVQNLDTTRVKNRKKMYYGLQHIIYSNEYKIHYNGIIKDNCEFYPVF